jgi:Tryptophan dimethylallyltransferase
MAAEYQPAQLRALGFEQALMSLLLQLTGTILPHQQGQELLTIFSSVVAKPLEQVEAGIACRSNLCADGFPVEFSLAFNKDAEIALRFVCDTTDAQADDSDWKRKFRERADHVIPPSGSDPELIDFLFEQHLRDFPAHLRFRVWHGAGFTPGRPRVGKLYFNTEWLPASETNHLLSNFLSEADVVTLASLLLARDAISMVGYDFGEGGLSKVKAYVKSSLYDRDAILQSASLFTEAGACSLLTALDRAERHSKSGTAKTYWLSFGFLPDSGSREIKIYLHAEEWGWPSLAAIAPVLNETLANWELPPIISGNTSPRGIVPTLLAFTARDEQQSAALYFKPNFSAVA